MVRSKSMIHLGAQWQIIYFELYIFSFERRVHHGNSFVNSSFHTTILNTAVCDSAGTVISATSRAATAALEAGGCLLRRVLSSCFPAFSRVIFSRFFSAHHCLISQVQHFQRHRATSRVSVEICYYAQCTPTRRPAWPQAWQKKSLRCATSNRGL